MKKTMKVVLAVLAVVFCLSACAEETVTAPTLRFVQEDGMSVMQLAFSDEGGCVTTAGVLQEADKTLCLTGQYLNGTAEKTADGYLYAVPETIFTLCKRENVDGVLLYWGNAYGVAVTDAGEQMIYTLDETLEARSWTTFYNQALRWQKEHGESSGGTGLE